MRHRKLRTFFALFVFLFAAVGAVQIILYTDLPRRWVMRAVSQELGVKVTARSLRTNLWGRTTIRDLALTLPMEEDPFLAVSHVGISHSPLPFTLLGGSLGCRSVRIVSPMVTVRQDETGRWNVQQFASRLSRMTTSTKKQTNVSVPELDIVSGASTIVSRTGHVENIGPIFVHGVPQDPARWDFEMYIPSQVVISGKVGAAPDWAHEIRFDFRDLNDLAGNWIPGAPEPLSARGTLYGNLRQSELTGKLQLDQLQCGRTQAHGTLGISVSAAKFIVRLEELLILDARPALKEFKIAGGSVQLDEQQVRADHVLVETGSVSASVTGRWDRAAREATLGGSWTGAVSKPDVRHAGTWNGSMSWPQQIGTKQVAVSVTGRAKSPKGHWQGELEVQGSGKSWSTSQWQVFVPRLESTWKGTGIALEDIRADIDADWPGVQLVNLSTANAEHLKAQGEFSAQKREWTISIEAEGFRASREQGSPVDLRLIAHGGPQNINVTEFRIATEGGTVESAGKIALPSTELSAAYAKASWRVPTANVNWDAGKMSGRLQCEATLTGVLRPTDLDVQMQISGENIAFDKKAIGHLRIPCHAQIDSRRAEYKAGPFQLFGGSLNVKGQHDYSRQSSQLALDANEVLLQPVADLFDLPLTCQGSAKAHLEVDLPLSDMNQMTASGTWEVRDMNLPPIQADSARGRIRIQSGTAAFDQIHLKQDQGLASASVQFRLDQPHSVSVKVVAQQWPTILPKHRMSFVTDGSGDIILDLSKRTAAGKGTLSTSIAIDQSEFGHVSAKIAAEHRTVNLSDMKIELLGGTAGGAALIPLDDWLGSRVELQWRDLDTAALADWWPELDGLAGRSSGSLTTAPTDSPRALERLGLEVRASNADCGFRGARIGGCRISAYLGEERLLIDRSQFDLMEGTVSASGNLRLSAGKDSVYVSADFSQLKLDQLVHLFLPSARPVEGRLSGKGMLVVLSDLRGLTGRADMQLRESDLARTALVSTLYDALNLRFADRAPTGQGQISLRFEGSSLKIPSFAYFNRGAEIRGAASIQDLTRAGASPVTGYAIGSVRPLKGTRLPGIEDLDRLMASLQTGVSSVKIRGTLAEPDVAPVPFRDVGQALRALLWRQLGE